MTIGSSTYILLGCEAVAQLELQVVHQANRRRSGLAQRDLTHTTRYTEIRQQETMKGSHTFTHAHARTYKATPDSKSGNAIDPNSFDSGR